VVFIALAGGMLIYFKLAVRFQIIDRPNERSSHRIPTVRGGGIVFMLALLMWFVVEGFSYPWFIGSALLLAVISFMDDINHLPALVRSTGQLIAFSLMGVQAGLFDQSAWLIGVTLIIGIGAVNAFNFMDGINGITGLYSLVNVATLYFINCFIISFTSTTLIIYILLSVVIFLFFNFRPRARCFAGDVGSVTLAFIQIFLILQVIYATGNYGWSLLFLLYGIDSIVTIIYRLKRKENIFKAHRSHLYQYFSNELGVPHLIMSLLYGIIQLLCNVFLVLFLTGKPLGYYVAFILFTGVLYVVIRERVLRRIGVMGLFG
jgi:UDP-N-acetylmuramyl pentapeptide phosphotransferase/UDP-N-acetylglucosamine-1-phosphate transferase